MALWLTAAAAAVPGCQGCDEVRGNVASHRWAAEKDNVNQNIRRGELARAAAAAERLVELGRTLRDRDLLFPIGAAVLKGRVLRLQQRYGPSAAVLEDALALAATEPGLDPMAVVALRIELAEVFIETDRLPRARSVLERAVQLCGGQDGTQRTTLASMQATLAYIALESGRTKDALGLVSKAVPVLEAELGVADARLSPALLTYGRTLSSLGRFGEAEVQLKRALAIDEQHASPGDVAQILGELAGVYRATNRDALAGAADARATKLNKQQ